MGRNRALALVIALAACDLANVEILPAPDVIVATATVVVTVDPSSHSHRTMHVVTMLTRHRDEVPFEVPGASVVVASESGHTVPLVEAERPRGTCTVRSEESGYPFAPVGSCYTNSTSADSFSFSPGESLSLTVTTPEGEVLHGVSTIPATFLPTDLTLAGGRCRIDPDTSHRFTWHAVKGAWAHFAEAEIAGLNADLWSSAEALYLPVSVLGRGREVTDMVFPRDFLLELLSDVDHVALYRTLHAGLPGGASADIAFAAADRNWANWIREGRANLGGVNVIPSVFGDGTGWFGTAVRWKVEVESRAANEGAGEKESPLCGPPAN